MKLEIDVNIPEGWEFVRFGVPRFGEYFLHAYYAGRSTVMQAKAVGDWVNKYPIIKKAQPKRQITTNKEDQTVTMILPRKEAELVLLLVGNHTNSEVVEAVLKYAKFPYELTLTVSDLDSDAGHSSLSYQLHDAIKEALKQF